VKTKTQTQWNSGRCLPPNIIYYFFFKIMRKRNRFIDPHVAQFWPPGQTKYILVHLVKKMGDGVRERVKRDKKRIGKLYRHENKRNTIKKRNKKYKKQKEIFFERER
jgi:hypothetical protein